MIRNLEITRLECPACSSELVLLQKPRLGGINTLREFGEGITGEVADVKESSLFYHIECLRKLADPRFGDLFRNLIGIAEEVGHSLPEFFEKLAECNAALSHFRSDPEALHSVPVHSRIVPEAEQ